MTNSNFDFGARITRLGIYTTIAALIANFIPVGYLALGLGISPPVQDLVRIWLVAAAAFGVGWFIQVVSFFQCSAAPVPILAGLPVVLPTFALLL